MRFLPFITIISTAVLLVGCKPGPVTLGERPVAVTHAQGKVTDSKTYSNYQVNKKNKVEVPAGLKGADLTTAKIQAAYNQDLALKPYSIAVKTHRGLVTLTGTVPNKKLKNYAIKIARYTKGVLAVDAKNLIVTG